MSGIPPLVVVEEKVMFGFIVGTLSLIGFVKVLRWGRGGGRFGYGGGPRRWMMRRLFQHLDTTPGQEKVIAAAAENAERAMRHAREQLLRNRGTVAVAMRGETFDSAAINDAFEVQQTSIDDLKKTVREGLQSIHEALTPEQRGRLADLVEFGPARMHGGGCAHGRFGHGGPGHFRHAAGGNDTSTVSL